MKKRSWFSTVLTGSDYVYVNKNNTIILTQKNKEDAISL